MDKTKGTPDNICIPIHNNPAMNTAFVNVKLQDKYYFRLLLVVSLYSTNDGNTEDKAVMEIFS